MKRLVAALAVAACGGSPGVMTGARPNAIVADAGFVDEPGALFVSTSTGIHKLSFDGKTRTKVFAKFPHKDVPAVSVVDISLDWKTWLLSDSDTNLWIGDPATGNSVEVRQLHHRSSDAAVSPDGKWIAATRHSDYGGVRTHDEDDGIFLIEIATGKVDTIPAQTKNWPTRVQWAADGSALLLTMAWETPSQWVTLADRKRTEIAYRPDQAPPAPLRANPRIATASCPQKVVTDRWQPELALIDDPAKPAHTLVRLDGRTRGFHDYLPDFAHAELTPHCKFVVFEHDRKLWITDLAGGAIAPLVEGNWLFFAP